MDTGWIQVFVLTLAECVAPAGKTVCQESELELVFLTEADCRAALEQLVELKSEADDVIVDAGRSGCTSTARQKQVFADLDAINDANRDNPGWRAPAMEAPGPGPSRVAHEQRLERLKTCDETNGVAPCKIGEIIIEGANSRPVDVWRQEN